VFEIGNSLREARLRQGLDFPELEQSTKIRGKYLRALEAEQFEVLPAQTYVRGFLRTYAEFLGLDGQLYVDEFNSRYVVDEEALRPRRTSSQRTRQQRRVESRVVVLALLGIAAVTALVLLAWRYTGGNGTTILPTVTAPTTAQPPPEPAATPLLVLRGVRGPSFVRVRAGSATGRILFSGTLARGGVQRFAQPRLWVQIAQPRNVRIVVRGKTLPLRPAGTLTAIVAHDRLVPAA
jgi:hypothetical protein